MDPRNVRVMKAYEDTNASDMTIYIDESARETLATEWGEQILVKGRRDVPAKIKPLNDIDSDAYVARVSPKLLEDLMVEYGENLLLYAAE